MAVGRTYELKARFQADIDSSVDRSFASMHTRLNNLEKKIKRVNGQEIDIPVDEDGATRLEKRLEKLEQAVNKLDKSKAEPKIGADDTEFKRKNTAANKNMDELGKKTAEPEVDLQTAQFVKNVKVVEQRVNALGRKTAEIRVGAKTEQARQEIAAVQRQVRAVTARIYDLKVRGDVQGVAKGMAELEALERQVEHLDGQVINVRTNLDTDNLARFSMAMQSAASNFTSFDRMIQNASRWGQVLQNFGQLGIAAFVGLAAAASGPLLSALTILGGTIGVLAGGFGLVAAAAIPIVHHFATAKQRAQELESAQSSLETSTKALATAQSGLKDAVQGVAEARRSGAESVRSAIESERSAALAVDDAQRAYKLSHEESADAAEELDDATSDLNYALQTEQSRLQSMRLDVQGMKLSQKELALEVNATQKELAKGDISAQERAELQLRLQQLNLQQKQGTLDIANAQRELTRAEKNGTSELQSATEARDSAKEGVEAAAQAEKDAKRTVQESLRAQRQAAKDTAAAREDASRQVNEALDRVKEAEKEVSEAAKQVKEDQNAVNAAMKAAPKYMNPLIHAVNRFKEQYTTSFKGANEATSDLGAVIVRSLSNRLPALGRTAEKTAIRIRQAFQNLKGEFTKFGAFESFQRILRGMPRITGNWTQAIGRFAGAFLNIMGQAMPYIRRFSEWVNRIALQFLKWTNSEEGRRKINQFLKSAAPVAKALFHWFMKIAGAILSWSIKHPKELADVVGMIGQLGMALVWIMKAVMNQLFRVAEAKHPWLQLGLTILGVRVALKVVALAFGAFRHLAIKAIILAMRGIVIAVTQGARLVIGTFGGMWRLIAGGSYAAAGRVALTFGIIGASAISAAWYIVNAFNRAYTSVTQTTPQFAHGLIHNLNLTGMSSGEAFRKAFVPTVRFAMAETYRVVVGAMFDIKKSIANLIGKIPGLGGVMDDWQQQAQEGMNRTYKTIAGKTALSAKAMGKNMAEGKNRGSEQIQSFSNNVTKDMNSTSNKSANSMDAMKVAMIKNSKEGGSKGTANMRDFNLKGTANMKDLFKGTDLNLGKMKDSGISLTGDMKGKGLGNFEDFKKGGIDKSDLLKIGAIDRMGTMQSKVNASTQTTQEKGVADLIKMQEDGTSAMRVAQEQWVKYAWDTSIYTQKSFNAILEGIGRFIDKADIDMAKPDQFSIIGNPDAGRLAGGDPSELTPQQRRLATGGIMNFAAGGRHGPVGGVAEGTTRVYGEVPGTTEFYITDNKKYRSRNMEILQAANQHMFKNASGNIIHDERTGQYRRGQEMIAPVNTQGWNLMGGDKDLGVHGPGTGAARTGARLWRGALDLERGRDAYTAYRAGPAAGRTGSNGTITVDPQFRGSAIARPIWAHELGHAAGLGHSRRGLMSPRVGPRSRPIASEIRWMRRKYGGPDREPRHRDRNHPKRLHMGPRGDNDDGSPRRGGGGGGRNYQIIQNQRQTSGSGRNMIGNFPMNPFAPNFGDKLRNSMLNFFAAGGTHKPPGMSPSTARLLLDQTVARHQAGNNKESRKARGDMSYVYDATGATTHNWEPWVQEKVNEMSRQFPSISMNTYVGHGNAPGGGHAERTTVDHWGGGGRGSPIGQGTGDAVADYVTGHWAKDIYYYIWDGFIHGWGKTRPYAGAGPGDSPHYDHVHVTYSKSGGGNLGPGGDTGPSAEEINKWWEDSVPTMPNNLGYGVLGEAASMAGSKIRTAAKEKYIAKVPTGSGSGGLFSGSSPGGLTIGEAVKQGGFPDSQIEHASAIVYRESGGNAKAQNPSGARGLMQIMPIAAKDVNASYGKLYDPVYNTSTGHALWSKHGWSPWVTEAGWQSGTGHANDKVTGYSHGGVVTKPHLGVIGDKGPEVNLPLDDNRAMRMMSKAMDRSKQVGQHPGEMDTRSNIARRGRGRAEETDKIVNELRSQTDDIVRELREDMELGDESLKKLMTQFMQNMVDLMASPQVGGRITNKHSEDEINYHRELRKR